MAGTWRRSTSRSSSAGAIRDKWARSECVDLKLEGGELRAIKQDGVSFGATIDLTAPARYIKAVGTTTPPTAWDQQ